LLIRKISKPTLAVLAFMLAGCEGGVLDPKGQVGMDEKHLIIVATLLMLIVVIPVIFMTLFFAWKYRDGRDQEVYAPKWAHSNTIEIVVWVIPIVIVTILSVITWNSTHDLDPYKPLDHPAKPVTVEVVSLDWKWLFIYPEYGVASVNELAFPANVPVNFKITSDTAMNSFFIPQLGSQIYSMAGMATQLHLIANEPGSYQGISANYSGAGFSGMKFTAIATPTAGGFDAWVAKLKQQGNTLDVEQYKQLAQKSKNNPVQYFGSVQKGMFNHIVMQYMHPDSNMKPMDNMEDQSGMHNIKNMEPMTDMNAGPASEHSSSTHSTTEHSSTASAEAE